MNSPQVTKHVIDASGRVPGRIATEVAVILMGKDRTDFARNRIPDVEVEVISSSKMLMSAKKLNEKMYYRYSGYPGGLKSERQSEVKRTKGARELLRRAVYGMLPKNKLRVRMMKNLKIKE
jgi:large subunit ribosomal protein L13